MTDGDRTAAGVHQVGVDRPRVEAGQRLHGERLVELDRADVGPADTGGREGALRGLDRGDAEPWRLEGGDATPGHAGDRRLGRVQLVRGLFLFVGRRLARFVAHPAGNSNGGRSMRRQNSRTARAGFARLRGLPAAWGFLAGQPGVDDLRDGALRAADDAPVGRPGRLRGPDGQGVAPFRVERSTWSRGRSTDAGVVSASNGPSASGVPPLIGGDAMLRTLSVLFLGITLVAACTAAGTSPVTSYPASPAAVPSANPSTVPSLQPTPPATTVPTPHPTPVPTLPAGTAAPPARGLTATARQVPCPGPTGFGEFVQAAEVAGTGPGCVVADLGWVPAQGADAVYRIYMTWSAEGARPLAFPRRAMSSRRARRTRSRSPSVRWRTPRGVGSAASTWQPRTASASPIVSSSRASSSLPGAHTLEPLRRGAAPDGPARVPSRKRSRAPSAEPGPGDTLPPGPAPRERQSSADEAESP